MWLWRGRRGFLGQVVRLVLGASIAVVLCVAGVGFGDIRLAFVQQAWHLVTSTWLSCGRSHTTLSHNFVAHNSLSRTRTHTLVQLFPAQLCHTHTQLFHTSLSHTTLPHTILFSRTTLCLTKLFHIHTHASFTHTTLPYTQTQRCHMQRFSPTRAHTHTLSLCHTDNFSTHNSFTYDSCAQPVLHHPLCVSSLAHPTSTLV